MDNWTLIFWRNDYIVGTHINTQVIPRVGEYYKFNISESSTMSVPVNKIEYDYSKRTVLVYLKG